MDGEMESQWIICMQCETEFEYDATNQIRDAEKGFDAPLRCPSCRKHKTKYIDAWERKKAKNGRNHYHEREEDSGRRRRCKN